MNTNQTGKMETAQALQMILSTCEAGEAATRQEHERAMASALAAHERTWGETARGFEERKVALEVKRTALRQHAGGPLYQAVAAAQERVGRLTRGRDFGRALRSQADRTFAVLSRMTVIDTERHRHHSSNCGKAEVSNEIHGLINMSMRECASDSEVNTAEQMFEEARHAYEMGTMAVHSETEHLFAALEQERLAAETTARDEYERVCAAANAVRDERLARISQRRQEALDSF